MSIKRKHVFTNEYFYHVYNRGIDRRNTFTNKREYQRMLDLLSFYQYINIPLRYSRYNESKEEMQKYYFELMQSSGKAIEI